MANEKKQDKAPEGATLEGIRIPKSLMPSAKITHAGRSKKVKVKQVQPDGTIVEVEEEVGGTIDKKDHEYKRQVQALAIDAEDPNAILTPDSPAVLGFVNTLIAYLMMNRALSVKGAAVVIKRPNGTEQLVYTKDPDDKGEAGQQDGRMLIPCKGIPTTLTDLVTLINDATETFHNSAMNAKLTADFAVKSSKKSKAEAASDGTIPEDVQY